MNTYVQQVGGAGDCILYASFISLKTAVSASPRTKASMRSQASGLPLHNLTSASIVVSYVSVYGLYHHHPSPRAHRTLYGSDLVPQRHIPGVLVRVTAYIRQVIGRAVGHTVQAVTC
jgi:hypothetical protein